MHRFSRRNLLGWIAGAASLVIFLGFQFGIFNGVWGVVAFAAAIAVGAWWLWEQWDQLRHRQRVERFAAEHGWTYSEVGPLALARGSGFPFGVGTDRRVANLIEGVYSDTRCISYDYVFKYKVADERSAVQVFTVTQASLPVPFPRLDLIPEDAGSRMLGAITGSDIDLESAEFNRAWRVLCSDRRYAVDVVDPRMMQLLLSHRMPGVAIRIEGDRVLAWSAGRADVADLRRRLDVVVGVAKRIPAHVVRTYTDAETRRRAEQDKREANAPTWAKTPGVLNSRRYTGIGVDADGDGVEDWEQRSR